MLIESQGLRMNYIKGCHCAAKQYNANTVKLFLKAASKIAFIYLRMCMCGMLRGVNCLGNGMH